MVGTVPSLFLHKRVVAWLDFPHMLEQTSEDWNCPRNLVYMNQPRLNRNFDFGILVVPAAHSMSSLVTLIALKSSSFHSPLQHIAFLEETSL